MSLDDPRWPRASAWLGGDHESDAVARLGVVGVPLHVASLSSGRCDLAPNAIREALHRYSTFDAEDHLDVRSVEATDLHDAAVADLRPEDALEPAMGAVRDALEGRDAVAILGGDNSVTRPGVQGLGIPLDRVGVLTLDAHHDLRDTVDGLSNGNPIRALLEDGLPGRNVVQIGIQPFANSPAYAEVAGAEGITVITAATVHGASIEDAVRTGLDAIGDLDAVYVDLDVDVLDRAFAPACSGSRPGGLTPWQVQRAARMLGRHQRVWAIDIVEVDPTRDVAEATALAAASFVLSFAAGLAARHRP